MANIFLTYELPNGTMLEVEAEVESEYDDVYGRVEVTDVTITDCHAVKDNQYVRFEPEGIFFRGYATAKMFAVEDVLKEAATDKFIDGE